MALNAYLTVKGQKQGNIKGSVTQKGREGTILVHAASHEIVSPRDAASGLPTGKRMHKPFVVTKEVDRATPLLYQAMVSNEQLPEWTLRFARPTAQGVEHQHYTVKLTNPRSRPSTSGCPTTRSRTWPSWSSTRRSPSPTGRSSGRGSTGASWRPTTGRRRGPDGLTATDLPTTLP